MNWLLFKIANFLSRLWHFLLFLLIWLGFVFFHWLCICRAVHLVFLIMFNTIHIFLLIHASSIPHWSRFLCQWVLIVTKNSSIHNYFCLLFLCSAIKSSLTKFWLLLLCWSFRKVDYSLLLFLNLALIAFLWLALFAIRSLWVHLCAVVVESLFGKILLFALIANVVSSFHIELTSTLLLNLCWSTCHVCRL